MKKKLLSAVLALSLTCTLALPAAAQSADERLADITARVKQTLWLDTEEYTDFYGNLNEHILAPTWNLEWSGEEGGLSVTVGEDGCIASYHRYTPYTPSNGDFAPSFPDVDRHTARRTAQSFLDRVLRAGEHVVLEDQGTDTLNTTSYRFRGELLINGLSAGMNCSVAVSSSENEVTSFYRDDLTGVVMGGIPSPVPAADREQAKAALRDTLSLYVEYVLPEEGAQQAVLRYLPRYGDSFYVDAQTGELVNLTQLSRELEKGSAAGGVTNDTAAAAPEASAPGFTQAEQSGVEKLEGVLTREVLDKKARSVAQFGLDSYTLSSARYSVSREEGDDSVTAVLTYGRQVEGRSWRRTLTMDAKSGEVISLYSSAYLPDEAAQGLCTVDEEAALDIALGFMDSFCPDEGDKTALYRSYPASGQGSGLSHSFTFAQQENGYFFPANSIHVGVDATDGSISAFSMEFDHAVTFRSPEGMVSMDEALDSWLDTYEVELGYTMVPTAIDYSLPQYRPLMDSGVSYLSRLVLSYTLQRESAIKGIDAMTGEPVPYAEKPREEGISYTDLEGHWAQDKVERLAQYGVGYREETFRPQKQLTQLDLIALLASAQGYHYQPGQEDDLYRYAYDLGLLERGTRQEDALLTRSGTVKVILDAVGYGSVAQLEGIFRTGFADDSAIPAEYYGYVALAQGLGMISGTDGGVFSPNQTATRAQAAVMLYMLMDR